MYQRNYAWTGHGKIIPGMIPDPTMRTRHASNSQEGRTAENIQGKVSGGKGPEKEHGSAPGKRVITPNPQAPVGRIRSSGSTWTPLPAISVGLQTNH